MSVATSNVSTTALPLEVNTADSSTGAFWAVNCMASSALRISWLAAHTLPWNEHPPVVQRALFASNVAVFVIAGSVVQSVDGAQDPTTSACAGVNRQPEATSIPSPLT